MIERLVSAFATITCTELLVAPFRDGVVQPSQTALKLDRFLM